MSMDAEFQGLLWTIALDSLFLLGCFVVFRLGLSRKGARGEDGSESERRGLLEEGDGAGEEDGSAAADSDSHPATPRGRGGLWASSYLVGYAFFVRVFGEYEVRSGAGVLYLKFEQISFLLLAALSVVAVPVLVPLYLTGRNRIVNGTWLQETSVGNLPLRDPKLWGVFAAALLVLSLLAALVWAFRADIRRTVRKVLQARNVVRDPADQRAEAAKQHTVHITGIDRALTDEALLAEYMNEHYPGRVQSVHIVGDHSAEQSLLDLREREVSALERLDALAERRGGRPVARRRLCGLLGSEDARDRHRARVAEIDAALSKARRAPVQCCGHAFVVFRALPALETLEDVRKSHMRPEMRRSLYRRGINIANWRFRLAPPPADIQWRNLHVGPSDKWSRWLTANMLLLVLMVAIIAPVAIISHLRPLLDSARASIAENSSHPQMVLVFNYTPALVVFLVNSLLLPFLIELAANFEQHDTVSSKARSVFRKNAFFLTLNTIIVPSLALNSIAAFIQLTYNTQWERWQEIVGTVFLQSSGHFFIQYTIHAALLGAGAQFLDLSQWIWRSWKLAFAVTAKERARAREVAPFDFGYWYSARLVVLSLVVLYSCMVPLIVPVGVLFFLMSHWVDSFNFRAGVYSSRVDTNGVLESTLLRHVFLHAALFQFAMGSFFVVQGSDRFYAVGSLLFAGMLASILMYFGQLLSFDPAKLAERAPSSARRHNEKPREVLEASSIDDPDRLAEDEDRHVAAYTHPLAKARRA